MPGNFYKGNKESAVAWFKEPSGNILSIIEMKKK